MKYNMLVNILDRIRLEAPERQSKTYMPDNEDIDRVNAARSRAYIHLFLKVSFGITNFIEREKFVTDGSYDGGIDGYYIEPELRTIYIIQSKFRTTKSNFESKEISLEEILVMDIDNILGGNTKDEQENEYNGKIKQFQREISNIQDIARYSYKVIILANLNKVSPSQLKKLTDGYSATVFDYSRTYNELVFPVVSGTLFTANDICIPMDLSNKNAGSKISYTVKTKVSDCEITVLFAPTIEIAKIMSKYKNSILKYNPRSYLELEGQAVNNSIRNTIFYSETNEFALYNNGITMLSDETYINERIGQKNKAQLSVKNPQIINGGQTSYILSRIYEENINSDLSKIFDGKEVLLKVITLIDNDSHIDKLQLIDEISNATNKQTPVINADRFANDKIHQNMQRIIFDRFGLLYERKRGEFSDGLNNGYINQNQVIERNLFLRIYYASNGYINTGSQKKLFQKNDLSKLKFDDASLNRFFLGFEVFNHLIARFMNKKGFINTKKLSKSIYAKIYIYNILFSDSNLTSIHEKIERLEEEWNKFLDYAKDDNIKKYNIIHKDKETEVVYKAFNEDRYINSHKLESDVIAYFNKK
ncbi:AIPR family protein [Serratia nevei]|uniref:AIPR family protein n=1 Tax=Serratia nevei TaxID=2703794 RepID=UPI0025426C8E|nr:AIPR family protein [Serratia nevei]WIJ65540.1 AIPR family protein [Serratia nevei]